MNELPHDHGKSWPGWCLYLFALVVEYVGAHGMEMLSAAAVVVGIAYHLVLIRNARIKHRLEAKALEAITAAAEAKATVPWPGLLNYDQREGRGLN